MELGLTDKVVFISGSSRGIGLAIAAEFLRQGAKVMITGRDGRQLERAEGLLQSEFGARRLLSFRGDLTKPAEIRESVRKIMRHWKKVDCLVANIGSGAFRKGWRISAADWNNAFEINFWSAVRLVNVFLPSMIRRRKGSIVFVGSIAGLESIEAPLCYSAAKAALVSYAKELSRETGAYNVRVNCVAPGNILFPGSVWEDKLRADARSCRRTLSREVPLGRFGTPDEVANGVIFLCSERSGFTTGGCYVMDGGQTKASCC